LSGGGLRCGLRWSAVFRPTGFRADVNIAYRIVLRPTWCLRCGCRNNFRRDLRRIPSRVSEDFSILNMPLCNFMHILVHVMAKVCGLCPTFSDCGDDRCHHPHVVGIYGHRSKTAARINDRLSQFATALWTLTIYQCYTIANVDPWSQALHCCKAHSEINRKMENSTPCKIVTPENFILKLGTRDYGDKVTYYTIFDVDRFSGGFSTNKWSITLLWLFSCPVLSCVVLSFLLHTPSSNRAANIHALWLKWRDSAKGRSFWG